MLSEMAVERYCRSICEVLCLSRKFLHTIKDKAHGVWAEFFLVCTSQMKKRTLIL